MIRDVDAQDVVLLCELDVAVPLDAVGRRNLVLKAGARHVSKHVEHRELPHCALLLAARRGVDDVLGVVLVDEVHELHTGVARGVEGACLDEGLDHAAVCLGAVHALAEVVEVLEGAVGVSLGHDALANALAHAADAGEAKAHALGGCREVLSGLVDIGRQHLDALATAARDVVHDLVGLAHVGRENRGHVLAREVRLEPRSLHDQDGVAGGVGLVERVGGKLQNVLPDLLRYLALVAVRDGAVHPVVVDRLVRAVALPVEDLVGEHLDLLLCHRLAHARV